MKINPNNIYKESYIRDLTETAIPDKSQQNNVNNTKKMSQLNYDNKVITKTERDFFINMFPENTEQLRQHILFNQNGKIHSPNISKGTIVDGLI